MSESDNVKASKKWNLKKNETSKKEKEILKEMKSKNFKTQSISVSDNVRIWLISEPDNVRVQKKEKKRNLKEKEIQKFQNTINVRVR